MLTSSLPLQPLTGHTLPDVTVLLRPAQARLVTVQEKERLIRSGVSYGELLTPETVPTPAQQVAYAAALARSGERVAQLLVNLLAQILTQPNVVLVSLARGGTPVGCALRALARRWGHDLPHYTISIIRGVGPDAVALGYISRQHPQGTLIFVDGWTGKGSIYNTLVKGFSPHLSPQLAVLSDPAGVSTYTGTYDDLLLPHAALNATVSGLLSRTFYTDPQQLHAARIEEDLRPYDVSQEYLNALESLTACLTPAHAQPAGVRPTGAPQQVLQQAQAAGVHDPHLLKPSVGEATRVFLRRSPAELWLRNPVHPDTLHLVQMAQERGVPVRHRPELPYLAAALIAAGESE